MNWLIVVLLVLFLISGGAGGYLWWRRRHAPAPPPDDDLQTAPLTGIGAAAPSEAPWENEQDWVIPAGQFQRPASRSVDDWHAHEDWER